MARLVSYLLMVLFLTAASIAFAAPCDAPTWEEKAKEGCKRLRGAKLYKAKLRRAKLRGANLRSADLRNAPK